MTHYDLKIWQTYDLYNNINGWDAATKAEEYFYGAFDNASNHSIDVTISYDYVYAPTEIVLEELEACDPCYDSACGGTTYSRLGYWWEDELDCDRNGANGYDCHLLLTNYDSTGGHAADNYAAAAEGGRYLPDLPDYQYLGSDDWNEERFNAMQTALHEAGHCFLEGGEDNFDEHNVGRTVDWYLNPGGEFRTPFHNSCGDWNGENECYQDVECNDELDDWVMGYSSCCQDKMELYD